MDTLGVRVEPARAGFFAGEAFHVRIALRNERSHAPSPARTPATAPPGSHARFLSQIDLQTDALSDTFRLAGGGDGLKMSDSTPTLPTVSPSHHHLPQRASVRGSTASARSPLFPGASRAAPGHEHLLWAYAQLSGTFSIDEALIKPFDFELVKQRIAAGALHADAPSSGRAIGGGELIPEFLAHGREEDKPEEMDLPQEGMHDLTLGHASLDSLVLGLGLPSPLERTAQDDALYAKLTGQRPPRRVRSLSVAHLGGFPSLDERNADGWTGYLRNRLTLGSGQAPKALPVGTDGDWARVHATHHRRTGSTLADKATETVLAREIPTLSMPPSVLCVDLTLAPGQEESFDLTLPLPPDLPPSYIGRAITFTYSLSIGINRLQSGSARTRKSRIVQIPIRVFTHVSPVGEPPFWDLLNPIIWLKDHAVVTPTSNSAPLVRPPSNPREKNVTREDLEAFARSLLSPQEDDQRPDQNSLEREEDEESNIKTCLERAELLTRTSPKGKLFAWPLNARNNALTDFLRCFSFKVSYDIAKDGQIAAILTLTQSKYRLGDTIRGVLTINQSQAGTRIVRAKVQLECYEEIQPDVRRLETARSAQLTTRVIESTEEALTDMGQWAWELTVSPTLAPSFHTSALTFRYAIKLSLLTLSCVKPAQISAPPVFPSVRGGAGRSLKSASTSWEKPGQQHPSGVPVRTPIKPVPPPHLVPSASDGFGAYHERLQAVPSFCGPYPFTLPSTEDSGSSLLGWGRKEDSKDERITAEPFDRWLTANHAGRETKLEIVECSVPLLVLPSRAQYSVPSISFSA